MTRSRHWRNNLIGYSFIFFPFLVYAIFVLYPVLGTLQLSFTNWDGFERVRHFVGMANYVRMWKDPFFLKSLYHNLIWILIGTSLPIAIGLPLAVILWSGVKGFQAFRTIYFMPLVLSSVVVGIIWGWIYNPVFGIANEFLRMIGLSSLIRAWLGDTSTALPALIIAAAWQYYGFCVIIFLAGLQNVDISLIDAAKIDGASSLQRFFYVIVPQMRNVLTMIILYTLIGGFKVFDLVFVTTQGGPAGATELLATYLFKQAFQLNYVGYAAAMAIFLAFLVIAVSVLFIRLRERVA